MGNKENPNNNGIPESDIVFQETEFLNLSKKKTILLFMQPYTPQRLHELFF